MPLTTSDYRTQVRTHLDVAAIDMPDSIIDAWTRLAHTLVARYERRWPFLQRENTGTMTPSNYWALSSIAHPNGPVEEIQEIRLDSGEELYFVDVDTFHRLRPENSTVTGVPQFYTVRRDTGPYVAFHPSVSSNTTFKIRYYKQPYDFVTAGPAASPSDFPEEFHWVILLGVLHFAFMHQEMLQQSRAYKSQFDEQLVLLQRRYTIGSAEVPVVHNAVQFEHYTPPRLRFPWE